MDEHWKPVSGWPYEVSSLGRVRNAKGHILSQPSHKSGYLNVQLWNSGKFKTFLVHRLIASAFHGKPPTPRHEVGHNDGNRHNNQASNLRWVSHLENMRDRDIHGKTARGQRNGKLKHGDDVVLRIRELHTNGLGSRRIAKAMNMSRKTVHSYMNGTRRAVLDLDKDATK